MSRLESSIEGSVVQWAKKNKIIPLKLTPVSDGGWPDHLWLFFFPGIAVIEFKQFGKEPDERQLERLAQLRKRGYPAYWTDNRDHAIRFLTDAVLGATSVPGARYPTWDYASMRWLPPTTRNGEDNDILRDQVNSSGKETL